MICALYYTNIIIYIDKHNAIISYKKFFKNFEYPDLA